jgi:hypothetical protein
MEVKKIFCGGEKHRANVVDIECDIKRRKL